MNRSIAPLAVLGLLAFACWIGGRGDGNSRSGVSRPSTAAPRVRAEDLSMETKLAVLDGRRFLDGKALDQDAELARTRIRFLLNRVSKTSGTPADEVGEKVYRGRQYLESHFGKAYTSQVILEKLDTAYLSGVTEGRPFDEVLAGLLIVLGN